MLKRSMSDPVFFLMALSLLFTSLAADPAPGEKAAGAAAPSQPEEEVRIPVGETKTFTLHSEEKKKGIFKLEIYARLNAKQAAGSDSGLKLILNGKPVEPSQRRVRAGEKAVFANRLLNRKLASPVTATDVAPWFRGEGWRAIFAADFEMGKAAFYEGDPYRLVLDVTDLMDPAGQNRLEIKNVVEPAYVNILASDCALVLRAPKLSVDSGDSLMLAPAMTAAHRINRGEPGAGSAPYRGNILPGGGFSLECGGRRWIFASAFSQPKAGFNRLTEAAASAETAKAWAEKLNADPKTGKVSAECPNYKLVREVTFSPRCVTVTDQITNTTAEPLGMIVSHELSLRGVGAGVVRLAGLPALDEQVRYYAPPNPSVHVESQDVALGLICDDDVFCNQATLACDFKKETAGLSTDKLFVPAKATRTLRWLVYPVASPEYYDFINLVRQDRGSNYTIPGPWHVFGGTEGILKMDLEDMKKNMARLGLNYTYELGGWVDHDQTIKTIGFGYDITGDYWKGYRAQLKKVVQKLKEARPGIKVLVYYDTLRDTCPDSQKRFADSRQLGPDGNQVSTDWGGLFQQTWSMVPTLENSFGKAMSTVADSLPGELGADGLGWDEIELIGYGDPLIAYNMPDGFSCIVDEKDNTFKQQIGFVTLLSRDHRLSIIELLQQRGQLIMGNSPPCTRKLLHKKLPRFIEVNQNDLWHYQGNLSGTLGYIGWEKDWATLLRCLRLATLPIVPRLDYEYEILPHLFPFTPIELHYGYLLGEERIITLHSGNYGWPGMKNLARPYRFDTTGKSVQHEYVTTIKAQGARTRVEISDELEAAVLEKLPVTLANEKGDLRVRDVDYGPAGLTFTCTGPAETALVVEDGKFQVEPGARYAVTMDGKPGPTVALEGKHLKVMLPAMKEARVALMKM